MPTRKRKARNAEHPPKGRGVAETINSVFDAILAGKLITTPTTEAADVGSFRPLNRVECEAVESLWRALVPTLPTFQHLTERYHVDAAYVILLLIEHRVHWVLTNQWRVFESRSSAEIEQWPNALEKAAEILDAARGALFVAWEKSFATAVSQFHEAVVDRADRTVDKDEFITQLALTNFRRQDAGAHDAKRLAVSEAFEQYETLKLAHDGGITLGPAGYDVQLTQQIEDAIAVIRKAAMTIRRLEWGKAIDPDGQRVFRRGRRKTFVLESDCAQALVEFFRHETNRALYEHVGEILKAVYPETCGRWGDRGKPLRDRVKQLLRGGEKSPPNPK